MDDAGLVSRLEGGGDLQRDVDRLGRRERPALQPLGEVLAGDQLHREEAQRRLGSGRGLLVQAVDRGDVGVVEGGEQLGLALEAGQPLGVAGERVGEDLDGDLAVEGRVEGLPDHAHAALADLLDQAVVKQVLSGFDGHSSFPFSVFAYFTKPFGCQARSSVKASSSRRVSGAEDPAPAPPWRSGTAHRRRSHRNSSLLPRDAP